MTEEVEAISVDSIDDHWRCQIDMCKNHADLAIRQNPGKVRPVYVFVCKRHAWPALGTLGYIRAPWQD